MMNRPDTSSEPRNDAADAARRGAGGWRQGRLQKPFNAHSVVPSNPPAIATESSMNPPNAASRRRAWKEAIRSVARALWPTTAFLLAAAACNTAKAQTNFTDSLENTLDSNYWSVTQTTPSLYAVTPGPTGLALANTQGNPGNVFQNVAVNLNLTTLGAVLTGDFTTQVDISSVAYGPGQDQIQLNVDFLDGTEFDVVIQSDGASSSDAHVWIGSVQGQIAFTGTSGTLRIARSGSTLTGYVGNTVLFSKTEATAVTGVRLSLQNQPSSSDKCSVVFSNFAFIAPAAEPASTFADPLTSALSTTDWATTSTANSDFTEAAGASGTTLANAGGNPGNIFQGEYVSLQLGALGGNIGGDFSTQVSVADAVIGPGQDQIQLNVGFADNSGLSVVFESTGGGGEDAHVWIGSTQGLITVTGASGMLKVARVGSTLSGYFNGTLLFSETETSAVTAINFCIQNQPSSADNCSALFSNFSLTVPGHTHLAVAAAATETAGVSFPVTVTALDALNQVETGYTGTVQLTSSDPAATLPANQALANGVATLSTTLNTAGNATVTATDTATSFFTVTSANIAVAPSNNAFTYLTAFTKTNNIYTNLNEQFPNTGPGTPGSKIGVPNAVFLFNPSTYTSANAVAGSDLAGNAVDFVLDSDAMGHDFSEISTGTPLVIPVNVKASALYLLMGSYDGSGITITLTGADNATQTFSNVSLPDFNGGGTINQEAAVGGSSTDNLYDQTVFQVTDVGAGGTGNSTTGAHNTYTLEEIGLIPNATLAAEKITSITLTAGGYEPLLLGVTALTGTPPLAGLKVALSASAGVGNAVTATVTAVDLLGNPVTSYSGPVSLTSSDPKALNPATISLSGGTGTALVYFGTQGSQTVTATSAAGALTGSSSSVTVGPQTAGTPVFTTEPQSVAVTGGTVALDASATGATGYQWLLNGSPISGATSPILLLPNASAAVGSYTCVATNATGSMTSTTATVALTSTTNIGRLVNISCRAQVGTGGDILIAGFVVGGSGTSGDQSLLIRGSGPALAPFGVSGLLADPQLSLYQSSTELGSDYGWAGSTSIASAAAAVGAFAWTNNASLDSALLESLPGGAYTAQVAGKSGDTGVALIELYDATASGTYTEATPRLVNISARLQVGTGSNLLIAGFVVGGSTAKTVLIRASGPALAPFGVTGTLPDPELQLFRSNSDGTSTLLGANEGWGASPGIASIAAAVGAFPWGASATPDSAILVTLPPGGYTAQVSGVSNDTGVALVEVYEVP